jgi:putative transposase
MSERYKAFEAEAPYFITFTLVEWLPLFEKQEIANIMIDSLIFCQLNKGLLIFGYCIMPSHIHLIVQSQSIALGSIMRDLKKYTAHQIADYLKTELKNESFLDIIHSKANETKRNKYVKIWLEGYHPELIFSNKFFHQKLNYIHNNPVKAGLALHQQDYFYSSARNYAGLNAPLEIIFESQELISS